MRLTTLRQNPTCKNLSPDSSTVASEVTGCSAVDFEARGRHALATLVNCKRELLTDEQSLREIVRGAALAAGATVLQLTSHCFDPPGVTVVAVLAESHASLHTYPHVGIVFWDCFTCGTTCDPLLSIDFLTEALSPSEVRQQLVERE